MNQVGPNDKADRETDQHTANGGYAPKPTVDSFEKPQKKYFIQKYAEMPFLIDELPVLICWFLFCCFWFWAWHGSASIPSSMHYAYH